MTTLETLEVAPELRKLHGYLTDRGSFKQLDNFTPEYLHIFSRDVLQRIARQDTEWEKMVPSAVAEMIKTRAFFGYVRARTE
jgi:hypothetical protein